VPGGLARRTVIVTLMVIVLMAFCPAGLIGLVAKAFGPAAKAGETGR